MSWSISIPKTPVADFTRVVTETKCTYPADAGPEIRGQIAAAKVAAVAIVESGCLGPSADLTASLSGHANLDHRPIPGWANDYVTVTVTISQAT